ncbi:PepSY domain-containing protein [Neobacillus kokaensis]|uniref:PepSY domain-containing protein n=1 Tax=Neobacillus kokaensis TaxID=2759023 RepID=A0ABQ3N7R5_9BACI|nr:PepSY domain-containing protein [Neobacillus kokaensis]GHI00780.1 hypothetical protein AM1BK_43220 [Neobacillus kokaensis]
MMKRKVIIGSIAATVLLGGAMAAGAAKNNQPEEKVQKAGSGQEMISLEEAKAIALKQHDGIVEEIELKDRTGKAYYEVEIEKDDQDFDIRIDAKSGEVLVSKDLDDNHEDQEHLSTPNKNLLTAQEAKRIAEDKINGKVVEIEFDDEDGQPAFEVELKTNTGEVELKIDAVTGKILKEEQDN